MSIRTIKLPYITQNSQEHIRIVEYYKKDRPKKNITFDIPKNLQDSIALSLEELGYGGGFDGNIKHLYAQTKTCKVKERVPLEQSIFNGGGFSKFCRKSLVIVYNLR